MKILFATTNPAKVHYYAEELIKKGMEILTLKDVELKLDIDESGKNAVENARIKAEEYFNASRIVTVSIDDSLYIEGLSEEKQPGTNVRRVGDKRLDDNEMIEYYKGLVRELGGKVKAKWVKGVAVCDGRNTKSFEYSRSNFFFVDQQSDVMEEGYPLDSISIIPEFNKYLSELTDTELTQYKKNNSSKQIFDFIMRSIDEDKEI